MRQLKKGTIKPMSLIKYLYIIKNKFIIREQNNRLRRSQPKRKRLSSALFLVLCLALLISGCADEKEIIDIPEEEPVSQLVTIGFSQVGSESDWRMACTRSIQDAFTAENGYSLIFNDGQQKQEKQIKAIREFIDQDVDYILLDPCVETGWDSALLEAKEAGIPVIVCDREVRVGDESLYTAWIGSNFYLEGLKACKWLEEYLKAIHYNGDVNIVDIQGTIGSSAQVGRTKALEDAIKENPKWNLLGQECGDFTTAKGKEAMESLLIKHGGNINVVYCENDNEAYGAIEAIKNAGYHIGNDPSDREMLILSFDSTSDGLRLTKEGEILANTECSPLYGPKLLKLVGELEAEKELEHKTYIEEEQFSAFKGIGSLRIGGESFFVTLVTDELIESREY